MPTTRRSAGSVRGRTGPTKGQSTISFSNKVTKSVTNDTKKAVVAPAVAKVESAEEPSHAKVDEVEDDVVAEPEDEPEPEVQPEEIEQEPEKTEAELEAEKITDAHITKYWKGIEKERIAPRVHQRDLDVSEKVLRYFDVSSQYGPCIGITRMKRWQRAERLGLNPPVEVLAVLMKEESRGRPGIETAHMDEILRSTAVGA